MPLGTRLALLIALIVMPPIAAHVLLTLAPADPANAGARTIEMLFFAASVAPGAAATWFFGHRLIAPPLHQLSHAVSRWQEGDWSARVAAEDVTVDFSRLATLLNGIAERVDEEQHQLQHLIERAEFLGQETALAKAQLVDALDAIPEGFAIFDADDRFLLCNNRYREIFADTAELLRPGESFANITRESAERGHYARGGNDPAAFVAERLALRARPGTTFEEQLAIGEWYRVTDRRTSDGGIISVWVDITELKQREATFRILFEDNPLPMMVYDFRTLYFLEVNNAAIAHYGYSREQFLAITMEQIRPWNETEKSGSRGRPNLPLSNLGIGHHIKADGSKIIVDVISYQLNFRGRNAALIAALDITEQKRVEEALRASEAQLRTSQEHLARAQQVANIGSFERDFRTGTIFWSDNLYAVFGVGKASFSPTLENVLALIHPDDHERYAAYRRAFFSDFGRQTFDYRIVRPDGAVRYIVCEREVIRDEADGSTIAVLGTLIDVTAARIAEERQRDLEMQLQHAQRVEALGRLAGGIAHDLNNTMVPVVTLSKLTLKHLPEGSIERSNLELIHQSGVRARGLIHQILAFSRKEKAVKQRVDLANFVTETLGMIRATAPSTIQIDHTAEAGLPPVTADPSQLHQVLINLITNAVQAIGGEMGTITISLDGAAIEASDGADATTSGPAVRLVIGDTGCGMDKTIVDRIFEPFFTTKAVGEGTGLGLSVVHGIVGSHGGRITVASDVGRGTRITILLPAAAESDFADAMPAAVA
jgi:PAS domain S-box-containing protein